MKRPIDYFGDKDDLSVIFGHGLAYMMVCGLCSMRRFSVGHFRRSIMFGLMIGLGVGTGITVGNEPYKITKKEMEGNSS